MLPPAYSTRRRKVESPPPSTISESGHLPLLVTFRTKAEGGQQWISCDQYEALYQTVLTSGQADLIDLELFLDETLIRKLIHSAKEAGVTTVLSNHDFQKTPQREELRNRLKRMELLGIQITQNMMH